MRSFQGTPNPEAQSPQAKDFPAAADKSAHECKFSGPLALNRDVVRYRGEPLHFRVPSETVTHKPNSGLITGEKKIRSQKSRHASWPIARLIPCHFRHH
jgi:hypothetical protein